METFILFAFISVVYVLYVRTDHRRRRVGAMLCDGRATGVTVLKIESFSNLRVGLLNHLELAQGQGLWLHGARKIHTQGMLFPIDVVFLGRDGRVLGCSESVGPDRRPTPPRKTRHVLELAAAEAARIGLSPGKVITLAESQPGNAGAEAAASGAT